MPNKRPSPHLLIWIPRSFVFIIANIFLITSTEIDDPNTNIPISKFQELNMRKTCEKHLKKIQILVVHYIRYILLIFKAHIVFLLVYICFLIFTISTEFFDFHISR